MSKAIKGRYGMDETLNEIQSKPVPVIVAGRCLLLLIDY